MTDEQIKHMIDRFLGWRLPKNFSPDAGISFKAEFNEHLAPPMLHQSTGTNLFDATQAEAMVRYMVEGMPGGPDIEELVAAHKKTSDELVAALYELRYLKSPAV